MAQLSNYSSLPPSKKSADPSGDITTWSSFSPTATRTDAQASMAAVIGAEPGVDPVPGAVPGDDKIGNFIFRKSSFTPVSHPMYDFVFVFTIKKANTDNQEYNFIHRLFIKNIHGKYMHVDANFQPAIDVGPASTVWYDSIYQAVLHYVESLIVKPENITAEEKQVLLARFMK